MSGHRKRVIVLAAEDLTLDVLAALASLTPTQREAWVDRYLLGLPLENVRRQYVANANRKLREVLTPVLA